MEKVYVDGDGVENVAVGIVRQTKKDFIKGARILYGILHRIPTQKELLADQNHATLTNMESVRWMYDAWRFVIEDPYQFFGDTDAVINAWKDDAMLEHYSLLYLNGAEQLYINHAPTKKIHTLEDDQVTEFMKDNQLAGSYIAARNYILGLDRGEKIIKEINIRAINRARHPISKRGPKSQTGFVKDLVTKKEKNVKRAKELYAEGMTDREIAKEMEVTLQTVRTYLRS